MYSVRRNSKDNFIIVFIFKWRLTNPSYRYDINTDVCIVDPQVHTLGLS